jgi:hypothetical protein
MIGDRRGGNRDHSFARILINIEGKVGYIADVSDQGFKGLFPDPFRPKQGNSYDVCVSFEELGLSTFVIHAVLRWSRLSCGALEVGFELGDGAVREEDSQQFSKIREYYSLSHHPRT